MLSRSRQQAVGACAMRWQTLDAHARRMRRFVLYSFSRALHSQPRKRTAVFQWALKAAGELEEILST